MVYKNEPVQRTHTGPLAFNVFPKISQCIIGLHVETAHLSHRLFLLLRNIKHIVKIYFKMCCFTFMRFQFYQVVWKHS